MHYETVDVISNTWLTSIVLFTSSLLEGALVSFGLACVLTVRYKFQWIVAVRVDDKYLYTCIYI